MQTKTQIHGSRSVLKDISEFLVPSWAQLFLYLIFGVFILLIVNIRMLWRGFNASFGLHQSDYAYILNDPNSIVGRFWINLSHSALLQIVFWIVVGSLIYVVIWIIRSLVTNIRNDFVADQYVHGSSYNRAAYWHSVLARKAYLLLTAIMFAIYFFTSLRLLSYLASVAYDQIDNFEITSSGPILLLCLGLTMLIVHVFVLIGRTLINLWRAIYRDL